MLPRENFRIYSTREKTDFSKICKDLKSMKQSWFLSMEPHCRLVVVSYHITLSNIIQAGQREDGGSRCIKGKISMFSLTACFGWSYQLLLWSLNTVDWIDRH